MGLKAWAAAQAIKRLLGRDGMEWLKQNKRLVGAAFAAAGAFCLAMDWTEAAAIVGGIGTHLIAAGATKGDNQQKAEAGK